MFEEKDLLVEGKKIEPTDTSPVELNNASEPTEEEEADAGFITEPETPTPEVTETEPGNLEPELGLADASATKTFTQEQVDQIAGKARQEGREKALRDTYARYGVNSEEELDDLFGDAQRLATAQEEMESKERAWKEADDARNSELTEVKERIALLESGIDKNRFEDAKFILRGKGLEVTVENIEQELATHPEWKKAEATPAPTPAIPFKKKEEPGTQISVLGNEAANEVQDPEITERERAMKLFKV